MTITDMRGGVIDATEECITTAGLRGSAAKLFPRGTLLLSIFATIGRTALLNIEAATNQAIAGLTIKDPDRLDSSYLKRYLDFVAPLLASRGRGVAQANINLSILRSTNVPLPHLVEQRRIAAILDKADALLARRREAIAKLDQVLQSVFLDMFGDNGSEGHHMILLGDAFWFQEGPGVRKWQFTTSGVKLLNVGNIEKNGSINLAKTDRHVSIEEAQGKYKHFLADEGDLVIASSGISFGDDGLLRTRGGLVAKEHLPLCMNTSTIRFKAIEGKSALRYLQAWLNSHGFRSQITRLVTGSAQQNFGPSHLKQLRIPLPPLADQNRFCKIAERIQRQKQGLQEHGETIDLLFVSLQHRAFAGTL